MLHKLQKNSFGNAFATKAPPVRKQMGLRTLLGSQTCLSIGFPDTLPAMAEQIPTIIPHADFGAPDCCGCLVGIIHRGQARLARSARVSSRTA
jgi:hypothetical protein